MSDNQSKKGVIHSLKGLKSIFKTSKSEDIQSVEKEWDSIPELHDEIPILNDSIPVLNEQVPVLNEQVDLPPIIKVSLDKNHTSETIEQQLSRTHHEKIPESPKLVDSQTEAVNAVTQNDESVESVIENDYLETEYLEDTDSSNIQFEVFNNSNSDQNKIDSSLLTNMSPEEQQLNKQSQIETISQQILDDSWNKLESLLMEHFPTQIAASYLNVLDQEIENNQYKILSELKLLDESLLEEILHKVQDKST